MPVVLYHAVIVLIVPVPTKKNPKPNKDHILTLTAEKEIN